MKDTQKPRLNIYELIKAYYSFVFSSADSVTAQHTSLYMFLVNQNNRVNWAEWFRIPIDACMLGSMIRNKKTYYKCLNDLSNWGFIEWQKGANDWRCALCKLLSVEDRNTVPIPEVQKCTTTRTTTRTTNPAVVVQKCTSKRNATVPNINTNYNIPFFTLKESEGFHDLSYTYDQLVEEFMSSDMWHETLIIMDPKLKSIDNVKNLLKEFCDVLKKSDQFPINLKEAKNRFVGWLNKKSAIREDNEKVGFSFTESRQQPYRRG